MNRPSAQSESLSGLNAIAVPDLWQQQAVVALRNGKDVVIHAPTGAGKTLIFELWAQSGNVRGQAVYTVPTRALANDKLAEWRGRGWAVGISTGDLSENLDAPVLVATLETQKARLLQGDGPKLLVIDEYQMIGDPDRGLNYELALALAPATTQLLLLSGSVANPSDVVKWLRRLGRDAVTIRHEERPVPLEEIHADQINFSVPSEIRGYWPRTVAKALAEDLGPLLIFAPRRQAAEAMAGELARNLPTPNPLQLSPEQKQFLAEPLAKLLKSRIAYHHSGLSYGARAGVVEPLAKAGQLRVVVATMGLAAGINFSLRSVALAGESYRRDQVEHPLRADEILQMFGRAGRRGLDEIGYVLITANEIRLLDARVGHLSRGGSVDWGALLSIMASATDSGRNPSAEAVRVQERLFTTKPIVLGVEQSLKHPRMPCGLETDPERARHVRRRDRQILNSRGEWEPFPSLAERPLREVWVQIVGVPAGSHETSLRSQESSPRFSLRPALSNPAVLEKVGAGNLVIVGELGGDKAYGRSTTVADLLANDRVLLAKWVRRLTNWGTRQVPFATWQNQVEPSLRARLAEERTPVIRFARQTNKIVAELSLAEQRLRVPVDAHGVALWRPIEREVFPVDCASCALPPVCRELSTATGVAMLWRRLGLIEPSGNPTQRGRIVSFFSQGDGLAIAAGLEDEGYALTEMLYDLANLDAGFRFCGTENRWGGRLAFACRRIYGLQTVPGYLENGLPPKYGFGAEQVVASVHKNSQNKHGWATELLGPGDIDRIIIEWRSLLRRIVHVPEVDLPRWTQLRALAKATLNETESPTLLDLPPLAYHQTRRVDHRLILRRH